MGFYGNYFFTFARVSDKVQLTLNNKERRNKMERCKKVMLEELPSNVKMSDKEILILIRDLFEMIKDNNQLIQLLSIRVSGLENKNKKGITNEISSI